MAAVLMITMVYTIIDAGTTPLAVPYPATDRPDAFHTQAAFTIVNAPITRTDLRIEHLFD
jgi:hypothetical protein